MSSDGTYPGRASRRVDREPPAAKRASAGAAAAILIIMAIFGFGGGVLLGNASGGEPQTPGADTSGDPNSPETAPADDGDGDTDETSGDLEITLSSPKDGGQARAGTSGDDPGEDIEFAIATNPAASGLLVELQRSTDGGTTWEQFGTSGQVYTLGPDGTHTTSVWSGRVGENQLRIVHTDDQGNEVISNPITVELVADDD
jgi:hypothetical protein